MLMIVPVPRNIFDMVYYGIYMNSYLVASQMFHNARQMGVSSDSNCYIRNGLCKPGLIHHHCSDMKLKTSFTLELLAATAQLQCLISVAVLCNGTSFN